VLWGGTRAWIVAFAFAGLVLRLAVAHDLADAPLFRFPLLDSLAYDRWAREIAAGDIRGRGVFHLAPLYPYLCGVVYALLPDGPLAVVLLQHLAGTGLAVAAGLLASAWGGAVAGGAAALLVALYRPLVIFENVLLPEVLGAVLLTAAIAVLARAIGKRTLNARPSAAAGWLLGLDALVRPSALLLALALAGWILLRAPGRRSRAALAFLLGLALAVIPVTVRNRIVGGEWVLLTGSGGFNFYVGNHPGADGSYVHPEEVQFAPGDLGDPTGRIVAERDRGRQLTAGEVSDYWRDRAFAFIAKQPGRAAALLARKVALVWNRLEIPQVVDMDGVRAEVPLLRLPLVGAGLLMPLALLGLVIAYPGRRERELLIVTLLAFTAATALFFVTDRYRIQAVPILALVAGGAVARLAAGWREGRQRPAPLAGMLAGLGVAFAAVQPQWLGLGGEVGKPWLPPMNRAVALAQSGADSSAIAAAFAEAAARGPEVARVFANRGEWHRQRGRFALARTDLERAVTLDPADPMAWTWLGLTQAVMGDAAQALESLSRAHRLDPGYAPAALALGQALLRANRPEEALAPLAASLTGPDSAAAHDALGLAQILTGDTRAGFVALAPERPAYALHLALALADAGEVEGAARAAAAAVAADPSYRPARLLVADLAIERGDRELARREIDTLLARDPNDGEALALRDRLGTSR
jgi:lipoprotein NlpI